MSDYSNTALLLVHCETDSNCGPQRLPDAADRFPEKYWLTAAGFPPDAAGEFEVREWDGEEGPVAALNRAVAASDCGRFLLLYADETPGGELLPGEMAEGSCAAFKLCQEGEGQSRHDYQLRLFPAPSRGALFEGHVIPDPTRAFHREGWVRAETVPVLRKGNSAYPAVRVSEEAERGGDTLLAPLWRGLAEAERQGYARAEEHFNQVLDGRPLLDFDRLAALNNLAHAQVEQHKLQAAMDTARRSLEHSPIQRSPYLILQRAHLMAGDREESLSALQSYLEHLSRDSVANLDTRLSASSTHYLMGEQKFREGDYEGAFRHYGEYHRLEEGEVDREIVEKLFIYSIELENREKSIIYFNELFGEFLPDRLDGEMSARLLESLSLFMDHGWYDFVSEVYEELVTHNPDDNELLNGWITTLIKNKEIEKAQSLISVGKKKKAG